MLICTALRESEPLRAPNESAVQGHPDTVRAATLEVMGKCCSYPNFVISSGCDIPPATPWENIEAFFEVVEKYYKR